MRLAVPAMAYLAITLGLPLFNGGHKQDEFWRHAVAVMAVVSLCWLALRTRTAGCTRVEPQEHRAVKNP